LADNESTEPGTTETGADGTDNVQHADWVGPTAAPAEPESAEPEQTDWVGPS